MQYIDKNGNIINQDTTQDRLLRLLYTHAWGRFLLKPFVNKWASDLIGTFMDSPLSKPLISYTVKKYNINLEDYLKTEYRTYNQFFTRKISKEKRPFPENDNYLISPADGKLSVYPITQSGRFLIKHTSYSVCELLKSEELAKKYEGGYLVVIRLTVDNYHRYCYPADGLKGKNYYIKGSFHTVNPIANDYLPIYKENTRTFTTIRTPHFGDVLQMEVGALCVGRIVNYHARERVRRGAEKGRFEFGGSTVILMLAKDKVRLREELIFNTENGFETLICMGDTIGDATN